MWPFKKRSQSDIFMELLPKIEAVVSKRWTDFKSTLVFKDEVPLEEQFLFFVQPMREGVRLHFPQLKASPDGAILLAIARGVVRSGTVRKEDLAACLKLPIEALE